MSSLAAQEFAEREAQGAVGAWLLRFSATEHGSYAFTVVNKDHRITHYRVTRTQNNEFALRVNGIDELFATLPALMEGASRLLRLRTPLCSSKLDQFNTEDDTPDWDARVIAKGELLTACATWWNPLP
jgi:hypothetical protein